MLTRCLKAGPGIQASGTGAVQMWAVLKAEGIDHSDHTPGRGPEREEPLELCTAWIGILVPSGRTQ